MAQQEKKGDSVTPSTSDSDGPGQRDGFKSTRDFGLLPIPRRLHYDPDRPPHFGLMMNIAFGLFSTFSQDFIQDVCCKTHFILAAASNLYYCQPLLSEIDLLCVGQHLILSTSSACTRIWG
jgi:hypothetical protein